MNYLVRIPYVCYNDAIMTSSYHIKEAANEEEAIIRACNAMPYGNYWIGSSPAKEYLRNWKRSKESGYHYDFEDLVPWIQEE